MKTLKKRKTTHKVGKSNGRSKKTNASMRGLSKNEMKAMIGGFDFSKLGPFGFSILSFLGKEAMKFGPEIFQDGMRHFKNKK